MLLIACKCVLSMLDLAMLPKQPSEQVQRARHRGRQHAGG